MSLIFNKKFYAIKGRETDRFDSLAKSFDLSHRFLDGLDRNKIDWNDAINFDLINQRIIEKKNYAIHKIIEALQ